MQMKLNTHNITSLGISFLLVFTGFKGQAQTYLNELMASNNVAVYDDFFEFDDWVEIYHEGGVLNLAGYYLSDREDNLTTVSYTHLTLPTTPYV